MPEKTKASKDNSLKLATLQHTHGDFNLLVTTNFKYHLLRISMKNSTKHTLGEPGFPVTL